MRSIQIELKIVETAEGEPHNLWPLATEKQKVHIILDGSVVKVESNEEKCNKCDNVSFKQFIYTIYGQALSVKYLDY